MFRLFASTVACVAIGMSAASAAVISPVAVEASNEWPFWGQYRAVNVINGSGMNGGLHDGNYNNMWMTDLGIQSATLTFDLGNVFTLSGVNLWNYNADFGLNRGVRDFAVSLSLDGINYSQALSATLNMGTGLALAAQTFALNGAARYVRLDVLNNYGDQWSAVGLSEVNFTAVPEPAGLGLLGVGLVGLGLARRRRA